MSVASCCLVVSCILVTTHWSRDVNVIKTSVCRLTTCCSEQGNSIRTASSDSSRKQGPPFVRTAARASRGDKRLVAVSVRRLVAVAVALRSVCIGFKREWSSCQSVGLMSLWAVIWARKGLRGSFVANFCRRVLPRGYCEQDSGCESLQ